MTQSDWNPERYARFGGLRLRPALDLLAQVGHVPDGAVIDLGCGNGAVGGALAARFEGRALVGVDSSPAMLADLGVLRKFLFERMYRHYRVNRTRSQARWLLAEMFQLFMAEPATLPPEWSGRADVPDPARRARAVCDYIAGMTDRYAIEEHKKLFSLDLALDL